ncbi:hypothetical protein JCM21900_000373 [Sporobolomyces salmonicolor]
MPPREELLLILDLTATVLRAGVGVHDLIRGPLIELPTRLGRKLNAAGNKVEDYLVGPQLAEAERQRAAGSAGDEFEVVHPLEVDQATGFEVVDWVGLEALFRYALHTSLQLARPPLAHPTVLSLPASLPPSTLDLFHRLLFERLLLPQLLISTRPFFAAAAAGVLSCVVLDIGARGEGSEISLVHENQVLQGPGGMRLPWADEGRLDDYCALRILEEDPSGVEEAFKAAKGEDLAPGELLEGLRRVVQELKTKDSIGFASTLLDSTPAATQAANGEEEDVFDVAKVVVEGKLNEIVKKKGKGKDADEEDEGDFVEVANPFAPPPPPAAPIDLTAPPPEAPPNSTLRIGPARHRYLEPLFFPSLLSALAPSASPVAASLGLTEYERISTPQSGVQEAIGIVLSAAGDRETRIAVSEAVVVVSSGKVASNKALGATLLPLLSPYTIDVDSGSEAQPKTMRYARVPDYFSQFKEHTGDWGIYLGECIMGKACFASLFVVRLGAATDPMGVRCAQLLISDLQSKLFMSKADYTAHGPSYYRLLESL